MASFHASFTLAVAPDLKDVARANRADDQSRDNWGMCRSSFNAGRLRAAKPYQHPRWKSINLALVVSPCLLHFSLRLHFTRYRSFIQNRNHNHAIHSLTAPLTSPAAFRSVLVQPFIHYWTAHARGRLCSSLAAGIPSLCDYPQFIRLTLLSDICILLDCAVQRNKVGIAAAAITVMLTF